MHALIQRVTEADVRVEGGSVGAIGLGLLVFVCVEPADEEATADRLVDKLLQLRVFADAEGRMNRSVRDVNGGLLLVSQFTLAADLSRGHRPSFSGAAPAAQGRRIFERALRCACERHAPVASGVFGADMRVSLVNDGPVTIPIRL